MKNRENTISKIIDLILIFIGVVMLYMLPHIIEGDGRVRYHALTELLKGEKLSAIKYSLIGPIFSTPLYFLGYFYESPKWWCERYNFILFVLGLACIYKILVHQVDNALLRKFIIILILGSMFPLHITANYGEVFTVILVAVGILAIQYGYTFTGWISIILGVANTPATIVGLGFVVLALIWKSKKVRFVLALGVVLGIILFEAWFRSGGIISYSGDRGYATIEPFSGQPGFSYPLFFGLISILFSFGKGIIWFSPGLLLRVKKEWPGMSEKLYESYQLWLFFLLGLVLVYSKWWSWNGGWFWGPRFFLFASIPASFAIAANLQVQHKSIKFNLFIIAILLLSFWVGVNGPVFGLNTLLVCQENGYWLDSLCLYVPEFGVLFRPFVEVESQLTLKNILFIVLNSIVFIYLALPIIIQLWRDITTKFLEVKQGFQLQF